MKLTKIYTRTGDEGKTSLVGGVRISKADIRLEAYGTVDELNSHIGLLVALLPAEPEHPAVSPQGTPECPAAKPQGLKPDSDLLVRIQSNLFVVGTHLATDQSQTPLYPSAQLPEGETEILEQAIDQINGLLPEKMGFVLPGGTVAAAQCHVCRTVCRRAERCIAALAEEAVVGPEIIKYVNRLSDYLFILAKKINFNAGHSEIIWQKACK
jgi:cob(I)alamin adenosyltransferase